jgi:hypothetical protein
MNVADTNAHIEQILALPTLLGKGYFAIFIPSKNPVKTQQRSIEHPVFYALFLARVKRQTQYNLSL